MRNDKLLKNIHRIMRDDPYILELLKGSGGSLDDLDQYVQDIRNQINVDTATWGLDLFEKEAGIKTDHSKSQKDRREFIKTKWKMDNKSDIYLLRQVVNTWDNGDVDITFSNDGYIHFSFQIGHGVPNRLTDIENAIDEVKPAHLNIKIHLNLRPISPMFIGNVMKRGKIINFKFGLNAVKQVYTDQTVNAGSVMRNGKIISFEVE